MTLHFTRRGFVRTICFILAAFLVICGYLLVFSKNMTTSSNALSYQYMKSMSDLSSHIQNIDSDLSKIVYTKTPRLMSAMSSKLWREAGLAKDVITDLPVEYLKLQNTNKFLSQVGNYCQSIAKSAADGQNITQEQQKNLKSLHDYSEKLLSELVVMNDAIQTGSINLFATAAAASAKSTSKSFRDIPEPMSVTEGFNDFEEGFTAYPTLIYDGPFSDHIMQKEPLRLKGAKDISKGQAKERVSALSGVSSDKISEEADEDSKMQSYGFTTGDADFSITKKGGLLCYMLRSRSVEQASISPKQAQEKADKYLKKLIDVTSNGSAVKLDPTYYEISNNVITFNYACRQGDVLVYPELIKVGVALDNGEVLSFDARGYIVNHFERDIVPSRLSEEKARESVSDLLKIEKAQRCIIPSDGLNEILCYEFLCKTEDEKQMLVYVNAESGAEERILVLLIDENGQLTI